MTLKINSLAPDFTAETSEGKFKVKDPASADNVTVYSYSSDQGVHDIVVTRTHLPDLKMTHVREFVEDE